MELASKSNIPVEVGYEQIAILKKYRNDLAALMNKEHKQSRIYDQLRQEWDSVNAFILNYETLNLMRYEPAGL